MDTLVVKPAERKRRRHSEEFKRQVVAACLQPGVSVAAIALANGLNANYLRRWVREHREASEPPGPAGESVETGCASFVPVTIMPSPHPPLLEIRLDVRRGGTTVQMAWPVEAAASLGQCLRELLR
jgi:transposase-like protein